MWRDDIGMFAGRWMVVVCQQNIFSFVESGWETVLICVFQPHMWSPRLEWKTVQCSFQSQLDPVHYLHLFELGSWCGFIDESSFSSSSSPCNDKGSLPVTTLIGRETGCGVVFYSIIPNIARCMQRRTLVGVFKFTVWYAPPLLFRAVLERT